ncbi:MAG: glycosyltransferase family 39 protein [Candidatus Omnitrophica bacterium]|nr:glycosyltransferase family 39 protein [Candidatus Omnitrophota bacterium]
MNEVRCAGKNNAWFSRSGSINLSPPRKWWSSTLDSRLRGNDNHIFVMIFTLLATTLVGFYSYYSSYFVPAIHDEMSYLFQARTFLLGRVVNLTHPERLFFDAYHIINEGIFASKYFPGFALTLVPFEFFKMPYLNPVFFYGLQLAIVFFLSKEMFGLRTAYLAVPLVAFSPQIVIQSCFLLSHLSSACFLLLFMYGFVKWRKRKSGRILWILFSGFFWGLAFLTRPTTAVGIAFPIAVMILWCASKERTRRTFQEMLMWGAVVALSIAAYGIYNKAVTGSYTKTPFELYSEIHAPYHRYGFNTWEKYRDEANGPRVDRRMNEYYHNHKLLDGFLIAGARLGFFIEWIFPGVAVGLFFILIWLIELRAKNPWHWPIFCIFLSLQAIYVPHWYPGLIGFGSNYLYEASALVLMAIADTLVRAVGNIPSGRWRSYLFVGGFCLAVSSVMFLNSTSQWVSDGRALKIYVNGIVEAAHAEKAVVFVRYAETHNLDWDLIDNVPTLDSAVVFARDRGAENAKLKKYFPNYSFFIFDESSLSLIPLAL